MARLTLPLVLSGALAATLMACGGSSKPAPAATQAATASSVATVAATAAAGASPTAANAAASAPAAPSAAAGNRTARQSGVQPGSLDPCALVTAAEAAQALGGAVGAPNVSKSALLSQCQYTRAEDPTGDNVTVQVMLPSPISWQQRRDAFAKRGTTIVAVEGVGEEAYWVREEGILVVRQRGVVFYIWPPKHGATPQDTAAALGRSAAGRV